VNSPFQKFKRNILLLLQLILLSLLILGAMQPYIRAGDGDTDRLLVLLDRSASMAALDKPGGGSRLDAARQIIRPMIEQMAMDQEMSLILFGASARQVVPFTSNKRMLLEALEKVSIEDVASDLADALRMAEAAYRTTNINHVLLLTDGNVPPKVDFDLPFRSFRFQTVDKAGPNIGITALSARRAPGQGWRVFAKVEGTSGPGADIPATLELVQDGQSVASERIVLGEGNERRIMFPILTEARTSLELRLNPESFDSLPSDNIAFLELSPPRPLTVYVSPALDSYRHALRGLAGVSVYPVEGGENDAGPARYDLMITDGQDEPPAEAPMRLHVGVIPPQLSNVIEIVREPAMVVDWRRATPLLEHVDLNDLVLAEHVQWIGEANEQDLENLRFESLVYGPKGPLLVQRTSPGRATPGEFYMLFHSDRSTLPFRLGFPILVQNLTERMAMHEAGLLEVTGDRAGVLPPLRLAPGARYTVVGPAGYERSESADDRGVLDGVPAPSVGRYTIREGGDEKLRLGVSLLQREESLLAAVEELHLAELKVAATTMQIETNRPLWMLLAWLALAMLAVEWWFYQKRPGA
jgi:Ca-activated chloride channel homolog